MKNGTEMPSIQFGEDTSFDTLCTMLENWCVRLWFEDTPVILVCMIRRPLPDDKVDVLAWSETAQNYITPLVIEIDKIRKIEVM